MLDSCFSVSAISPVLGHARAKSFARRPAWLAQFSQRFSLHRGIELRALPGSGIAVLRALAAVPDFEGGLLFGGALVHVLTCSLRWVWICRAYATCADLLQTSPKLQLGRDELRQGSQFVSQEYFSECYLRPFARRKNVTFPCALCEGSRPTETPDPVFVKWDASRLPRNRAPLLKSVDVSLGGEGEGGKPFPHAC